MSHLEDILYIIGKKTNILVYIKSYMIIDHHVV